VAETVGMPKLGLTMETGAVGAWLVAEGDEVTAGQVIAEIVTEKITYELEAETAGVVLKILLAEEEEVPVGTPIAVIGRPGEAA
jgi:pyruvate/2-oxoglutarate dehydrogenase complex dihydrolipoamide acyltransferase (E2) component